MSGRNRRWDFVSRESPELVLLAVGCVISYWLRLLMARRVVMARSALIAGSTREWPAGLVIFARKWPYWSDAQMQ